jgi:hypothetical protein
MASQIMYKTYTINMLMSTDLSHKENAAGASEALEKSKIFRKISNI